MCVKKGDILCSDAGKVVSGVTLIMALQAMKGGDSSLLLCPHCNRIIATMQKVGTSATGVCFVNDHGIILEVKEETSPEE